MQPEILFDRQGLLVTYYPAHTVKGEIGDGDDHYEAEVTIKILRPGNRVSLRGKYIAELKEALNGL